MFGDSVFVDTYPVIVITFFVLWVEFSICVKCRVSKFREDVYSRVFNLAIFFTIAKNAAKLRTNRVIRLI